MRVDLYRKCKKKKIIPTDIVSHCENINLSPSDDSWVQYFCNVLQAEIDKRKLKYSNMSITDLKKLLNNKHKNLRKKDEIIQHLIEELSKCRNKTMLLSGEPLEQTDIKKIYMSSSGYCHDIDELYEYLISTYAERNIDPNDPFNTLKLWQDSEEYKSILNFPHVDPDVKNRLNQVLGAKKTLITFVDMNTILDLVAQISFILLNDNPSGSADYYGGMKTATEALGYFSEIVSSYPEILQKKIYGLKNGHLRSIEEWLEDKSACPHLKGDALLNIYLYQRKKWNEENPNANIKLVPFIKEIELNTYCTPRFYGNFQLEKFTSSTPVRWIVSGYNKEQDIFLQLNRNYYGGWPYVHSGVSTKLSKDMSHSILNVLKQFKIK
jgi:hypothetical protein